MLKQLIFILFSFSIVMTSAAVLANENTTAETAVQSSTPDNFPNFFDPNAWFSAYGKTHSHAHTQGKVTFNPAHPSSWMKIVDPKTHNMMHMYFANPATYAQFMQPQFWMEFMKPENMMAWMDFNQYAVMMNPQTMAYWMNPTSYMHAFDPNMYAATMNPANYMVFMNPATYMGWAGMPYQNKSLAATE